MNRLSTVYGHRCIMWGKRRHFEVCCMYSLLSFWPCSTQAFLTSQSQQHQTTGAGRTADSFCSVAITHRGSNINNNNHLGGLMIDLGSVSCDSQSYGRSAVRSKLYMSSSSATRRTNMWDEAEVAEKDPDGDEDDINDDSFSSPLMEEYQLWSRALDNTIKSLKKKRTSLESELKKAQGVEETVARAQLLTSNLWIFSPGVKSATVQDWENDGAEVELVLDENYNSASEEADALFAQVRKLKRGSQVVAELLEETASAWELLQETQLDLKSALVDDNQVDQGRLALVQDRLERSARTTKFKVPSSTTDPNSKSAPKGGNRRPAKPEIGSPASNIRKLVSPGGCTVLVGRNRRGNEHLSLSIARGDDIWMHSRGCPGKFKL